jgi:hypothetical protein
MELRLGAFFSAVAADSFRMAAYAADPFWR